MQIRIFNGYSAREALKAAGARWRPAEGCWSLTQDQFNTLPQGALAGARVLGHGQTVSPVPGETFRLVLWGDAVAAESSRGVIAYWSKRLVARRRTLNSYYDRHRAAKGDTDEFSSEYESGGACEEVLAAVESQLPAAFRDAPWKLDRTIPATIGREFERPEFRVFEFLAGVAGGCAWFGNTPKNVVSAIRRAQKRAVFVFNSNA